MSIEQNKELQVLSGMLDQLIRQDAEIKQISEQIQKTLDTAENIKNTFIGTYIDWQDWVTQTVSKTQEKSNMKSWSVYEALFGELQKRAKCRLSVRLENKRKRMAIDGATKTEIESYRVLDVIEDNHRLKEIFSTIVKEYAIRYVA